MINNSSNDYEYRTEGKIAQIIEKVTDQKNTYEEYSEKVTTHHDFLEETNSINKIKNIFLKFFFLLFRQNSSEYLDQQLLQKLTKNYFINLIFYMLKKILFRKKYKNLEEILSQEIYKLQLEFLEETNLELQKILQLKILLLIQIKNIILLAQINSLFSTESQKIILFITLQEIVSTPLVERSIVMSNDFNSINVNTTTNKYKSPYYHEQQCIVDLKVEEKVKNHENIQQDIIANHFQKATSIKNSLVDNYVSTSYKNIKKYSHICNKTLFFISFFIFSFMQHLNRYSKVKTERKNTTRPISTTLTNCTTEKIVTEIGNLQQDMYLKIKTTTYIQSITLTLL